MKTLVLTLGMCVLVLCSSIAVAASSASARSDLSFVSSTAEEILDGAYQEILRQEDLGLDVPEETYNFYFAFERLVHPEFYEARTGESGALDQLGNACPGSVIIGPNSGNMVVRTCGSTVSSGNNCSAPYCRLGNDVVVQLVVNNHGSLTVRTAGSSFDTYICLYLDACCGEPGSFLNAVNNNAPILNYGQRLAAGFSVCVSPGNYWLVLDGAGPSARGSYCLEFQFADDGCGE